MNKCLAAISISILWLVQGQAIWQVNGVDTENEPFGEEMTTEFPLSKEQMAERQLIDIHRHLFDLVGAPMSPDYVRDKLEEAKALLENTDRSDESHHSKEFDDMVDLIRFTFQEECDESNLEFLQRMSVKLAPFLLIRDFVQDRFSRFSDFCQTQITSKINEISHRYQALRDKLDLIKQSIQTNIRDPNRRSKLSYHFNPKELKTAVVRYIQSKDDELKMNQKISFEESEKLLNETLERDFYKDCSQFMSEIKNLVALNHFFHGNTNKSNEEAEFHYHMCFAVLLNDYDYFSLYLEAQHSMASIHGQLFAKGRQLEERMEPEEIIDKLKIYERLLTDQRGGDRLPIELNFLKMTVSDMACSMFKKFISRGVERSKEYPIINRYLVERNEQFVDKCINELSQEVLRAAEQASEPAEPIAQLRDLIDETKRLARGGRPIGNKDFRSHVEINEKIVSSALIKYLAPMNCKLNEPGKVTPEDIEKLKQIIDHHFSGYCKALLQADEQGPVSIQTRFDELLKFKGRELLEKMPGSALNIIKDMKICQFMERHSDTIDLAKICSSLAGEAIPQS